MRSAELCVKDRPGIVGHPRLSEATTYDIECNAMILNGIHRMATLSRLPGSEQLLADRSC